MGVYSGRSEEREEQGKGGADEPGRSMSGCPQSGKEYRINRRTRETVAAHRAAAVFCVQRGEEKSVEKTFGSGIIKENRGQHRSRMER